MSGWILGSYPGNTMPLFTNANSSSAVYSSFSTLFPNSGMGMPFYSGLEMRPPINIEREANLVGMQQTPALRQSELETQLQQMFGTLTSMMHALPNVQSFMAYNPSTNPPPHPYGTVTMPLQSTTQPLVTVGGVGIPMSGGRVGFQGLMAIDMGINNTMSQIRNRLSSVGLLGG